MKQLTKTKLIRLTEQESHYLDVLSKKYKINTSRFIRQSIIEKLQRDMKNIREKHKLKDTFICPF